MVRKVHPVQRFSRDVVDGAPATASVGYLFGVTRQIGAAWARTETAVGRPGKDQSRDRAAQSWTLNRPCRAPDISRVNCAWLM
jgi:hypothetical protein